MKPRLVETAYVLAAFLTPSPGHAIDYPGGWVPASHRTQCVDICASATSAYAPGDYDFVLLEQLFVPQFCRDLLHGVDPTVSHQNVNPLPNGIQCRTARVKNELTLHGLWPNNNDGSHPACCSVSTTIPNHSFDAARFATHNAELLTRMGAQWVDATQVSTYDTLCEIYNHEFQKHGLCFAAFGFDYDKAATHYFEATLRVADAVKTATRQINAWATPPALSPDRIAWRRDAVGTTSVAKIKALYTHEVQVLCSVTSGGNHLSAIRTCFNKTEQVPQERGGHLGDTFTARDCPPAGTMGAFVPCNPQQPVLLQGYSPPTAFEKPAAIE